MTQQPPPPPSPIEDDLAEIARAIPRTPRAYSQLRELLRLLPTPLGARLQPSLPVAAVDAPDTAFADAASSGATGATITGAGLVDASQQITQGATPAFSGNLQEFAQLGIYNARFLKGVLGALPVGRTASLQNWTVVNDAGVGILSLLAGGGLSAAFTGLTTTNKLKILSDVIACVPGELIEFDFTYGINRVAGTLGFNHFVLWYDSSGAAISSNILAGVSSTVSVSGPVSSPRDIAVAPAGAAGFVYEVVFEEAGTHNASNLLTLYGVSARRVGGAIPPEWRYADSSFATDTTAAGTVNDWVPNSGDINTTVKFRVTNNLTLTGIAAPRYGKRRIILYAYGGTITLLDNDAGSAAANRFSLPAPSGSPYVVANRASVMLMYDDLLDRWVVEGAGQAGTFGVPIVTVYSSAGAHTWTKPAGIHHIVVECQGGGGGGGGAGSTTAGQSAVGAGGGGGGYSRKLLTAADLAGASSFTATVGGGGGGGGSGGGNGGGGSQSSFAGTGITSVIGTGGGGGEGNGGSASTTTVTTLGGGGAGASGGDLHVIGSDGVNGTFVAGGYFGQGHGGASHLGGATHALGTNAGDNGVTGSQWGGGGSGAYNNPSQVGRTGGAGGGGIIIITEYYAP